MCRNDAPFFSLSLKYRSVSRKIFNSCHESCVLGSWTFLKCIHCKQYFSSNTDTHTQFDFDIAAYDMRSHLSRVGTHNELTKSFAQKVLGQFKNGFSFYECFIQHPSPSQTNRVLNFFSCWSTHFLLSLPFPSLSCVLPTWQWMQMLSLIICCFIALLYFFKRHCH